VYFLSDRSTSEINTKEHQIFAMSSPIEKLTRITQTPGQCGGKPCIRGMRIRVSDILEMMAENVPAEEILIDFPDLETEDIRACLLFAARRTEFPRLTA
jgi:uncharacterized protein (DUF433 family)